ncbi:hypothetical protein DU504_03150 [Haloplanus salinus]|uniref:Uncharacterized protein n=1 Tax=Haloplanus salinus TaxID=1126245 RepID=A0A368N788_9EURY|nr:hypothetical protein DU504_03150 [Haloplanus salinus]
MADSGYRRFCEIVERTKIPGPTLATPAETERVVLEQHTETGEYRTLPVIPARGRVRRRTRRGLSAVTVIAVTVGPCGRRTGVGDATRTPRRSNAPAFCPSRHNRTRWSSSGTATRSVY